ncbi:hypothetical protein L288_18330 [Sphingobium quisquiliarum P25]|uniref:HTH tetR-type domain-containing protein n=1 Tax=Sphingobium quisquiliarum P25 TaxID=1329909 RepID=T0HM96_9SPHN|nr:TetR/AcrR family transcriptional regulator C-terminal domain-containing protein [Sphingobium quisquiliarum]EQB00435.1 hypothetical protein L288_18330 [Sphingobium quisquiliarum P25]
MADLTDSAAKADLPPDNGRPARRGRPVADSASRNERIIKAATALFMAKGFTATTMTEISRAAGVTKRTIYQAIGNKDALFREACASLGTRISSFDFDGEIDELPVSRILRVMAERVVRYALSPETVAFTRAITMETLRCPELVVEVMNAGRAVMNDAIAAIFARLMEKGRIAKAPPTRAADIFYDLIVGNRAQRALMGYDEPLPSDADLDERVNILMLGFFQVGDAATG